MRPESVAAVPPEATSANLNGVSVPIVRRVVSHVEHLFTWRPSMLKRLAALTVLAIGSSSIAHAASISGFFSAFGTDQFTSNTITFLPGATVQPAIGGDFATYLSPGTAINFLSGALPYTQGVNNIPPFPGGVVTLFTIAGSGGEVFTFNMTSYTASFITNANNVIGCANGSTCLNATGSGFFTGTGPLSGQSGASSFVFTSQYPANGNGVGTVTTFSASASALPTPEPASLALVGSGLLSVVALARRKFAV